MLLSAVACSKCNTEHGLVLFFFLDDTLGIFDCGSVMGDVGERESNRGWR